MAKEIKQVSALVPSSGVTTIAYTVPAGGISVCNAIIFNNDMADARFNISIVNDGKNVFVAKSQILPGRSSFETSRFTLEENDEVKVMSTNSITNFVINSINQSEI